MSYTVHFHPSSEEEYSISYQWYYNEQPRLGDRFEIEVESLSLKISETPEIYGYSRKPYREAKINGPPFTIVYKMNERKKQVYISAIFHTSRNPKKKYRR